MLSPEGITWIAYGLILFIGGLAVKSIIDDSCHCVFCKPEE